MNRFIYHPAVLTLIFLIGATFVPNNKTVFVWSAMYFTFLFLTTKSIEKTLLYSIVPFGVIAIGQQYTYQVINPSVLQNLLYPEGRKLYFFFTPTIALLLACVIIAILLQKRYKTRIGASPTIIALLLFCCSRLISAVQSKFYPELSILYTITDIGLISWILIMIAYLRRQTKTVKLDLIQNLLSIVIITSIYESLIVIGQLILRSPVGLKIEQIDIMPLFGLGADENPLQFRPVGLTTHANELANRFVSYFFTISTLILVFTHIKPGYQLRWYYGLSLLSVLFVIIVTQSRTAYFAIFATLIIFAISMYNQKRNQMIEAGKKAVLYLKKFKLSLAFFMFPLAFIISDRLLHTIYSFSDSGGATTRQLQNLETLELIKKNPFWGVGTGMYIPAAFEQNPVGIIKYFPEAVHNGFLLLLAENGVIGTLLYLFVFLLLWRSTIGNRIPYSTRLVVTLGTLANLCMMLFQPFINILSLNVVIYLMIAQPVYDTKSTQTSDS